MQILFRPLFFNSTFNQLPHLGRYIAWSPDDRNCESTQHATLKAQNSKSLFVARIMLWANAIYNILS